MYHTWSTHDNDNNDDDDDYDENYYVDEVIQRLWTAATNWPMLTLWVLYAYGEHDVD
jgi:hypothetical protein